MSFSVYLGWMILAEGCQELYPFCTGCNDDASRSANSSTMWKLLSVFCLRTETWVDVLFNREENVERSPKICFVNTALIAEYKMVPRGWFLIILVTIHIAALSDHIYPLINTTTWQHISRANGVKWTLQPLGGTCRASIGIVCTLIFPKPSPSLSSSLNLSHSLLWADCSGWGTVSHWGLQSILAYSASSHSFLLCFHPCLPAFIPSRF